MGKSQINVGVATAVVCAAVIGLIAMRETGTSQTPSAFETVGKIEPVSARIHGHPMNNGYPSVLLDKAGNLWCTWISSRQKNLNSWENYTEGDMVVLRRRTNGEWSETIELNTNFGVNFSPDLAEDADGNIFVVWSSRRDGKYRLFSRRVGPDLSMGSEIEILAAGKLEGHPSIVADESGRLWLAAQSWRNGSQDVVFYALENGGWRQMGDIAATPDPEFRPRITPDGNGGVWGAWDVYSGGKYRVRVRHFDVQNKSWGEPEDVPGDGQLDSYAPDLAVDREGRLWVTYARNSVLEHAWGRRGPAKGGAPRPTVRLVVRENGEWAYPKPLTGNEPGAVVVGDLPRIRVAPDNSVWLLWQTLIGHVNWKVTAAVYRGNEWSEAHKFGMEEAVALSGPRRRADQRAAFVIASDGNALAAYERGLGAFENREIYLREVKLASGAASAGRVELTRFTPREMEAVEREIRRAPKRMVVNDVSGQRRQLYMGDLHNHLLVDDGHEGSVDQLFNIHRDRFAMDFAATTSHGDSNKLLISELANNDALTEALLDEHSFVTIPGFEWTQGDYVTPRAGHRHIIYETPGGPLYRPTEGHSDSIREFVDLMLKTNGLIFAHHITRPHTGGTDFSYVNVKVEPCVEMCSSWGRFEYYQNPGHINGDTEIRGCSVQDAWKMGLRLGLVGGSDGHNLFGDKIQGVTGIYATELKRTALFEALRNRHCFATTGEPIQIDFRVNGHLMGSEISAEDGPVIEGEVIGTANLQSVEVVKYQEGDPSPFPTVFRATVSGNRAKVWWRDPDFHSECLYYLRVTQEADPQVLEKYRTRKENPFPSEMAWSSPVWVSRR